MQNRFYAQPMWKAIALAAYVVMLIGIASLLMVSFLCFMSIYVRTLEWSDGRSHTLLEHINAAKATSLILAGLFLASRAAIAVFEVQMTKTVIPFVTLIYRKLFSRELNLPSVPAWSPGLRSYLLAPSSPGQPSHNEE